MEGFMSLVWLHESLPPCGAMWGFAALAILLLLCFPSGLFWRFVEGCGMETLALWQSCCFSIVVNDEGTAHLNMRSRLSPPNIRTEYELYTTSGRINSGPPSTYFNGITVCRYRRFRRIDSINGLNLQISLVSLASCSLCCIWTWRSVAVC